jgi:predicted Rossmann fold flavoprotein
MAGGTNQRLSDQSHYQSHYDVIVLGAGAAGLMAAQTAAQRGRQVLVVEKANKPGKKILMSGGGRCNFTNRYVEADNYICSNPHFPKAALNRYTPWDFIALVERHEIAFEERKHSQLFCLDSARDILNMLLAECAAVGVEMCCQCEVQSLTARESGGYQLQLAVDGESWTVTCQSLVVATGALSIPTLGGSDLGYTIAEQFGLALLPRRAGLVPLMFSDAMHGVCQRLAGLALPVTVSCQQQQFTENLLFTHRGISGPAILQISNYWAPGDSIGLDLLPGEDVRALLLAAKQQQPASRLRTLLYQHLAKSLVLELQTLFWPELAETALAQWSDQQLSQIAAQLQNWQLKPSASEGYRTAEVTLGGVDTAAISSKTMQAKDFPGLYFIGEVLDVSGHLGGFNFQWAWSSGYSAGLVA